MNEAQKLQVQQEIIDKLKGLSIKDAKRLLFKAISSLEENQKVI